MSDVSSLHSFPQTPSTKKPSLYWEKKNRNIEDIVSYMIQLVTDAYFAKSAYFGFRSFSEIVCKNFNIIGK